MRIACISYYLPPVDHIGAGYQMHYTANAYVRAGHQVTMFSPYHTKDEDALYEMMQVPVGRRNRTIQFAWNLRKKDFSGFDLIHAAMDDYLLMGKKRPYHIRTFHGSCFAEAKQATRTKDKLRMFFLGLSEVVSCAVANRKVCVSQDTQRYLPFAREVIWNGVDTEIFRPGQCKASHPVILFIGVLDSRKRGRELLNIFKNEVKPAMPDAELWIVRESLFEEQEGVRWFGRVDLETLVRLYQQSWVFCLPSSYEGFGVPYIEAMACGTPVVATPNPGALEVLENGRYGCISDLPDLGKSLLNLLSNDQEREKLIQLGVVRAQEFSWDAIVSRYLSSVPASEGGTTIRV